MVLRHGQFGRYLILSWGAAAPQNPAGGLRGGRGGLGGGSPPESENQYIFVFVAKGLARIGNGLGPNMELVTASGPKFDQSHKAPEVFLLAKWVFGGLAAESGKANTTIFSGPADGAPRPRGTKWSCKGSQSPHPVKSPGIFTPDS